MDHAGYRRFTEALRERVAALPDVVGLVALGSMSGEGAPADAFSDHDFFLVVRPGAQERFRADLGWLPDAGEIALSFRETAHGLKVLYRSGHLLEFAVFDPDELALARVNRYRALLDRGDVGARMAEVQRATAALPRSDDAWLVGQLLCDLLVAAGRWRRGERRAGDHRLRAGALGNLLRLAAAHLPPEERGAPDDLDPFRRVERAWPRLAAAIEEALALPVPDAAQALLSLAVRELGARVPLPPEAVAAARRAIEAARR